MNEELIEKFLIPLRKENPTGEAIRYTPLYDQIQEARRSEDETLPRGIWETTVKKADWPLVVSLCTKGLLEQSKDLHLVGWLTEAWTELYGLEGLSHGMDLIQNLSDVFWEKLHPQLELEDPMGRMAPYEWIDHQISLTLLNLCITSTASRDFKNFSFEDWMRLQHLETVSKKQKDPVGYLQKEAQKGFPHPSSVRASIRSTPPVFYQKLSEKIEKIFEKIGTLENFLKHHLPGEGLFFYDLKKQLGTIKNFSLQSQKLTEEILTQLKPQPQPTPQLAASKPPEALNNPSDNPSSPTSELNSREKAYTYLAMLAEFLIKTEPHSPTPYLLRKALSWQNKTLLDVLQDFRKDPQALQAFLSLLDTPAPPRP